MKLILFDLDGVLIDAKDIHFYALNEALPQNYIISPEDHRNLYDGRTTSDKLKLLSERVGLPYDQHSEIMTKKQQLTRQKIKDLPLNHDAISLFLALKIEGYIIGVCSNSIRVTLETALAVTGLKDLCDYTWSAEDVSHSKPYPYIYWHAMMAAGVLAEDTIIIEDSPVGLMAAARSGANYIRVQSTKEVTVENIIPKLNTSKIMPKWKDDKLNVLIPMAGEGSRFANAGYTFPKPLIDIRGKPMIQLVVENLGLQANYIFVVRKEHRQKYSLDTLLPMIAPGCDIIEIDHKTDGAACTALLAQQLINNDNPLFIANSDQYVDWDPMTFMYKMQESEADGGIVTFKSTHPKWSFAKLDEHGIVVEVAEKKPISDNATVGFYYWKKGSDFVKYANEMIANNERVKDEFYICPTFNNAIADNKTIVSYEASSMHGLGTPEDLQAWLTQR